MNSTLQQLANDGLTWPEVAALWGMFALIGFCFWCVFGRRER